MAFLTMISVYTLCGLAGNDYSALVVDGLDFEVQCMDKMPDKMPTHANYI